MTGSCYSESNATNGNKICRLKLPKCQIHSQTSHSSSPSARSLDQIVELEWSADGVIDSQLWRRRRFKDQVTNDCKFFVHIGFVRRLGHRLCCCHPRWWVRLRWQRRELPPIRGPGNPQEAPAEETFLEEEALARLNDRLPSASRLLVHLLNHLLLYRAQSCQY